MKSEYENGFNDGYSKGCIDMKERFHTKITIISFIFMLLIFIHGYLFGKFIVNILM